MTVINTNTSSLIAKNAIGQNERAMSQAMTRLSTGSRINSARDDAAGLAISERMSSQISGLKMAARNANDAITLLQTADGATKEINSMLGRMRELAVQAASGTYTATDRTALDLEFGALMDEIDRIAANTEWNGSAILSGNGALQNATELANSKDIQLGADATQTMNLSLKSWRTQVAVDTNMTTAAGANRNGLDPVDVFIVTFGDLTGSQTVTVGGAQVTANAGATGAEIAAAFENISSEATASASGANIASVSGNLTGFTTASSASGATLVFTATTPGTASPVISGSGTHVTTGGTGGTANNSAFSSGVLFFGTTPTRIDITSESNAGQAITELDAAINGAAAERAKLGSYMSRLQHASDNLTNVATNTAASRSQIADADYASETTELARTQIISQASTAMLAQANQVKQTVLALLK
ncbi:flagellin [Gammaproteobacteria bacterium]|nr:flagellin [Gammaproteobacteria bacterium]